MHSKIAIKVTITVILFFTSIMISPKQSLFILVSSTKTTWLLTLLALLFAKFELDFPAHQTAYFASMVLLIFVSLFLTFGRLESILITTFPIVLTCAFKPGFGTMVLTWMWLGYLPMVGPLIDFLTWLTKTNFQQPVLERLSKRKQVIPLLGFMLICAST